MQEDVNNNTAEPALKARREFFRTSGRVALTAPAVALLLQASVKRAYAAYGSNNDQSNDEGPGPDDAQERNGSNNANNLL